jgi:serine phosphatase RsbU (regulator of sigma subunit)
MLTETDVTHCSQNHTTPEVLFVGNRPVSVDLIEQLNEKGYSWDRIALDQLHSCIRNCKFPGTAVIDASSIHSEQAAAFQDFFEQLDARNISLLLLNCPAEIDLGKLDLASVITSVEYEHLWARIESNIKFHQRLKTNLERNEAHSADSHLTKDTAKQLEMAGHVQRNFLPTSLPHTNRIRWAASFHPAEWVSGDIYDIARLDEQYVGFYLADVVGHSMPAALLTIFLKQAAQMRQTVGNDHYVFKPREVVAALNLRMSEQELNGCLFATCFYGLLNIDTLQLDYARAGHPYPVLIRGDELIQLQTRGGLLGIFPEADFEQQSVQLLPGDKLFIFSDGAEPMLGDCDDDGQFFFNESFQQICALPIDQMFSAFNEMTGKYRFKPSEIDDVTAVGLEILS